MWMHRGKQLEAIGKVGLRPHRPTSSAPAHIVDFNGFVSSSLLLCTSPLRWQSRSFTAERQLVKRRT